MWYWKPALRTLARDSGSLRPVRQAAGRQAAPIRWERAHPAAEPVAVVPRHLEIGEHHVPSPGPQAGQGFLGGGDRDHRRTGCSRIPASSSRASREPSTDDQLGPVEIDEGEGVAASRHWTLL